MKSDHQKIHKLFKDLQPGQYFQMVNTVMGTVPAKGHRFMVIENDEYNAMNLDLMEKVRIRRDAPVLPGL